MNLFHWLRWILGRGYKADYFDKIYRKADTDAWGYGKSSFHENRFSLILNVIPQGNITSALEVGCAEGHLTRHLARYAERVIACDISGEAIRRAQSNCIEMENIQFRVLDIRKTLLYELFDLIIYSDVLYYFSKREIDKILNRSIGMLRKGGLLVFANEWNFKYKGLSNPTYVIERLCCAHHWMLIRKERYTDKWGNKSLDIAVFRRL